MPPQEERGEVVQVIVTAFETVVGITAGITITNSLLRLLKLRGAAASIGRIAFGGVVIGLAGPTSRLPVVPKAVSGDVKTIIASAGVGAIASGVCEILSRITIAPTPPQIPELPPFQIEELEERTKAPVPPQELEVKRPEEFPFAEEVVAPTPGIFTNQNDGTQPGIFT